MDEPKPNSAFRQSLPVLITSLVNKTGAIGLSVFPMLLVEGGYTTAQSSLAMTFVKGTTVVATLLAGGLSDLIGLRITVLIAFLVAASGLTALPFHMGYAALVVAGVGAQLGITSLNGLMRLLLTQSVERKFHKESLGWMRTVNNFGQIITYSLATLGAGLGLKILIWFDASTSYVAFFLGSRILQRAPAAPRAPRAAGSAAPAPAPPTGVKPHSPVAGWGPLIGCTLLMAGWNFMYEFFISGVAGRVKVLHPDEGLRIFSLLMVVNTVLCAALAVVATRIFTRVVPSLALGVALTASGVVLGALGAGALPVLFASMLLITLGEIVYGALLQFLLIRSVPQGRRENTTYSTAIVLANLGRMLAAALAFPMIVDATNPRPAALLAGAVGVASLLVLALGSRRFTALGES